MAGLLIPLWLTGPLLIVYGISQVVDGFSWDGVGFLAVGSVILAFQIHEFMQRERARRDRRDDS